MTGAITALLLTIAVPSTISDTEIRMSINEQTIAEEPAEPAEEIQEQTVDMLELYGEPSRLRCTCYIDYGYTKSGEFVRDGIAAMNNEMIGKTAILYDTDMNYIGIFEILDTGGHKDLKNGTRIDIYRKDMENAKEWVSTYGDYVYVQLIDAVG